MSCEKGAKESKMIMLRRRLIGDVLAIRGKFCPTLNTEAFVIDPDNLKYPIDKPRTRVAYFVENFIKLGKQDFINPTPETSESRGKQVCDVLPNKPNYANLSIFGGADPNDKAGARGNFRYPGIASHNVRGEKKRELNLKDLNYVIDTLKQNHFPDRDWKKLGRRLGLEDSTLDEINEEYGECLEKCFEKCFYTWLKREDSTKQQDKSWASLAKALDDIGHKEVARNIRKEHQLNY
ncbi:PREDICTED: uncharacterized protein LOC109581375 [Amphimedon queenslandica]|nr:PREDICTED: uncharacterized protein LOC109581375 [Amphimedon queenslandica]|eukprot:XP_019851000.1 PREDICTED: uncharacterized protein LOC109581375 [Amphimedon queenslandica]